MAWLGLDAFMKELDFFHKFSRFKGALLRETERNRVPRLILCVRIVEISMKLYEFFEMLCSSSRILFVVFAIKYFLTNSVSHVIGKKLYFPPKIVYVTI